MLVKNVIVSALSDIGRVDLGKKVLEGSALSLEEAETVNTLIYCFNAVEDEVARKYVPITYSEELLSVSGKFEFQTFRYSPVKIRRVLVGNVETEYVLFPQYMAVDARKIVVEYDYAPSKKKIDGVSDFGIDVGEYLFAAGAVAEYYLINGEVECAELWEAKYRKEIDAAQRKLPKCGKIPPRRWV